MTTTRTDAALRAHLLHLLDARQAHRTVNAVFAHMPSEKRGVRPDGLPYSIWELLEHMRLAQADILDFCENPEYTARDWPDDYWPDTAAPPHDEAWTGSLAAFRADLQAMKDLVRNAEDLFAEIPHGDGQTYLREAMLVADHNAYHLGQVVIVRRLLGAWPPA